MTDEKPMTDEERRKVWWTDGLCLLCGNSGSAIVFIDGSPTEMEGPCPNCENAALRGRVAALEEVSHVEVTKEKEEGKDSEVMKVVVLRFLNCRGKRGASAEELRVVRDWVAKAELEASLMLLTLDGKIVVDVDDDGELRFESTPDGVSFLKRMEEVLRP